MLRVKYGVLLCLAALVNVAGCGGTSEPAGRPDREPVEVTVTYNGAAVDAASVTFYPQVAGGNAAYGATDANGVAQMTTFSDVPGDGAVPGDYNVTVQKIEASGEEEGDEESDAEEETVEKNLLPEKYLVPESSGLTASVTDGGDNEFTFDLTD